jgi:hypothetical protein
MKEIRIETMKELISLLNNYPTHFIFRGHTNSRWYLESTLERLLRNKWSNEAAKKAEQFSLDEFKSKFHLYDSSNKTPSTKLEWLSLMQHYGVPTRLLDFTESPYIALYFAIESFDPKSNNDLSIYAIDYRSLIKASLEFIKNKDSQFSYDYNEVLRKQDEVFESVLDRFSYDILWVTSPTEVNLRLDRQAGCFLISGNIGKRIEEIMSDETYQNVEIEKIIIPREFYTNIFTLLKKTNITGKALYGDLSGLAKFIHLTLKAYN